MTIASPVPSTDAPQNPGANMVAFTLGFAGWSIFSVVGIGIKP